jgi:hypothetical protein
MIKLFSTLDLYKLSFNHTLKQFAQSKVPEEMAATGVG